MVAHIRGEHWLPDGRPRRRHFTEAMLLRRVDVFVPERYFTPPCPDPGAEADVVEPLTCIAWRQLRQRSDAVNSIWEVERFLHMLHALLDYADFPTALAPSQGHDGHLPRVPDVVRWFFAAMGSRQCKPVWKTYQEYINLSCGYIVSGHWRGRSLGIFSRLERSAPEAARGRTRSQAAVAAGTSIAAAKYARTFFRKLSAGYIEEVVQSHGDHVPIQVRDDSVVLFGTRRYCRAG